MRKEPCQRGWLRFAEAKTGDLRCAFMARPQIPPLAFGKSAPFDKGVLRYRTPVLTCPLICIDLSNIERIFLFSLFHGAVCGEQNGQQTDG